MATFWFQVVPVAVLLVLGFVVGRWRERSHYQSLIQREAEFRDIGVVNLKTVPHPEQVDRAELVCGDAVMATDYFKGFAARLRNIVGGELKSYETLMERARREATLRVLEQARKIGATEVWNIRYETSNIRSASRQNPAVSVEVFAFGTAIVRR